MLDVASVSAAEFKPPRVRKAPRSDGMTAHIMFGVIVIAVLVGGLGGWAGTSSIAGAIVSNGTVVVESNVEKIQQQTGGMVKQILVRNGDQVNAGDVLVRFDETAAAAGLSIVSQQLDRSLVRMARLTAEATGQETLTIPPELSARVNDPDVAMVMAGEAALLQSDRQLLAARKDQIKTRDDQYREQIEGLKAQMAAAKEVVELSIRDLAIVQDLYDRKLVPFERLTSLQVQIAQQKGETARLQAAIAETEGHISENALVKIQYDEDFRRSASSDMRDTETKQAELIDRKTVAADQLAHTEVKAPQSGIVQELAIHTVGGAVGPGETMMLIVPNADQLVVDAQVSPVHIDEVRPGQKAIIRFSAFDRNTTPECHGTVDRVSADLIKDTANRTAYYEARVDITDEKTCLKNVEQLVPGMPVELHLLTGERNIWSYLMKPITDQFLRAFRE